MWKLYTSSIHWISTVNRLFTFLNYLQCNFLITRPESQDTTHVVESDDNDIHFKMPKYIWGTHFIYIYTIVYT